MEWINELKKLDKDIYGNVRLSIDGHQVSFSNVLSGRTFVIQWYYKGVWKGEYSNQENAIGQMFGKPIYYTMGKKLYEFEVAVHGKKFADKSKKEYESRIMMYHYRWNNATELIKHLKGNFKNITVLPD